jgi:hypothetical protein
MSRDAAFVEYALYALLEDVNELEQLLPMVVFQPDELKEVLNIPERLRAERIEKLRKLCADQDIGYAIVEGEHVFFKGLSPRRFEGKELEQFVKSVDEFEEVYGSRKADDMYEERNFHGVFSNPDVFRQVRGGRRPKKTK